MLNKVSKRLCTVHCTTTKEFQKHSQVSMTESAFKKSFLAKAHFNERIAFFKCTRACAYNTAGLFPFTDSL